MMLYPYKVSSLFRPFQIYNTMTSVEEDVVGYGGDHRMCLCDL
jgi:hypothetical protein